MSKKTIAYIAGYGSLVNAKSRRSTIGKTGRVFVGKVRGLRRTWLGFERNELNWKKFWVIKGTKGIELAPVFRPCYLDVTPDRRDVLLAAFIPVNEEQMKALDERESGYNRVEVTHLVMDWKKKVPVYIYMGKAECKIGLLHKEAAIPKPYEELCLNAAKRMSAAMGRNFKWHLGDFRRFPRMDVKLGDNVVY